MDKTIPRRDADFDLKQRIITETVQANEVAWKMDTEWLNAELYPKKAVWDAKWEAYKDPQTRTPAITFSKQFSRDDYQPAVRKLVRALVYNPRVSDFELSTMGISIPSQTRTPALRADSFPVCKIDSSVIRILKLYFMDNESHHRAKPRNMRGAEMRWAIPDSRPATVNDLLHSEFTTRSPFTLEFEEFQRGLTVYFCLRWENTRGVKGPWSGIISAIIP
ncbi:MAG: hypothetical protein LBS80_05290 [Tannerella sp.]|jgi:hypothetical protein|nr:hypothetical protein [Tannerella sp.]